MKCIGPGAGDADMWFNNLRGIALFAFKRFIDQG